MNFELLRLAAEARAKDSNYKVNPRMARTDKRPAPIETPREFQNPFAALLADSLALDDFGDSPAPEKPRRPDLGRVILRRETQHGARPVIIIDDFAASISNRSLQDLARKLRRACGCVGTIRQRTLQLCGNQVEKVRALLEREGFCVADG